MLFCSYQISHMHVGSIERQSSTTSGYPLQIHCKNFLNVTFVIPKERECQDVYASLLQLSQPGKQSTSVEKFGCVMSCKQCHWFVCVATDVEQRLVPLVPTTMAFHTSGVLSRFLKQHENQINQRSLTDEPSKKHSMDKEDWFQINGTNH